MMILNNLFHLNTNNMKQTIIFLDFYVKIQKIIQHYTDSYVFKVQLMFDVFKMIFIPCKKNHSQNK